MSDRKPSPEDRAARLEALLDDIQDAPDGSDDASSPDLDELDAAWGEDDTEDHERTVIGAVPELVAQTRPNPSGPAPLAVADNPRLPPPRERVDPQILLERANRRREKARAKAEAARDRKRAKAETAAKKQKQKQPKAKIAPGVEPKKARKAAADVASSAPAGAAARSAPADRRGRDVARMALLVSIVVLAGGALLFLLRR